MELNRKANKANAQTMVNPEGAVVWKDDPYRAAILHGVSLNLRPKRTFYYTDEDRWNEFIAVLDEMCRKDLHFVEALVPYLRLEHGRKLSPMVIIGYLLANYPAKIKFLPRFINASIIDTPKRMAEVMATYKLLSGSHSFASIGYRDAFRRILESYDDYTLRKNRMRRRAIKLADLIKVFRPKPQSEEMSNLYKAIIENRKEASLQAEEHVTALLSDTTKSIEEKRAILENEQTIHKMPFNALVRNLSQYAGSSIEVKMKIRERFLSVLEDLKKEKPSAMAVINPFMLMEVAESPLWSSFGMLQDIIAEMVDTYIEYWGRHFDKQKVAVLFDGSTSMTWHDRLKRGYAFLAATWGLFKFIDVRVFNDDYYAQQDYFRFVDKAIRESSPFRLYIEMLEEKIPGGGTALVDSFQKFSFNSS